MKWINNLKISAKLLAGFIIVSLIAGLVGYVGISNVEKIVADDKSMYENTTIPISKTSEITSLFHQVRVASRDIVLADNSNEVNTQEQKIAEYRGQISKLIEEYQKGNTNQEVKKGIDEYIASRVNYVNNLNQLIALAKENKDKEGIALLNSEEYQKAESAYMGATENLVKINVARAKDYAENNAKTGSKTESTMVILVILAVLLSIGLGVFAARIISTPIKKLAEAAKRLAQGDIDIKVEQTTNDEIGELNQAFGTMVNAIKQLDADATMLSSEAIAGNFDTRADEKRHEGEFRKIIEGVNSTLDTVGDKNTWYEAIIDAVPFPIHVTDSNMKWTFLNKAFEKLMIDAGNVENRKQAVGMPCSTAGANICNTENCGIKQLNKGKGESFFDWCGMSCKQDTSFLRNKKGEKIGYVEVVTDLTSILRVNDYTKDEVERMAANLDLLANGNLEFNLNIKEADEYTKETKENFEKINNNLIKVKDAVGSLIGDTEMLVESAIEGKLDKRADASKHNGEFAKIVDGVNKTLDSVINPLNEARYVMSNIALNDYTTQMTGNYQGMLKEFSESINEVRNRLLSVQDAVVKVSEGDISRLEEFRKIGKRSENDKLMPAVTGMMSTIKDLINETTMLADSAINGKLDTRGNVDKFEGEYRSVIEGMNETMNAVVKPIQEAQEVLGEMSNGNLAATMDGNYKGEYAKIKESINNTINSFNEILAEFNNAADQVAAGSRHVSDSSQSLSQGSAEQASSVEQITASIEEISAQTKQNAVNANQANELALIAKDNAVEGNEQMKGMLKAMEEINESSANISKIIKVIDEIAFQTNILALNAAVEAARAGQHGKGFAVVAEEVRNLAARSANAAKETTDLIEGSIRKVETGTSIANNTAEALNKIVSDVAKAATIVGEIAVASNEQATGIAQVNQGIIQVSQVTQTNTATAQQSASASEELSSQAQLLKDMVRRFKLKKSAVGSSFTSSNNKMRNDDAFLESMNSYEEAAPVKKVKISLDDKDFGKY